MVKKPVKVEPELRYQLLKKNSFLKNYEISCSSSEKILFKPVTIIHHFMHWEILEILEFVAFFVI